MYVFFFFKQKTAYEMRISDWSSDVCSSDLGGGGAGDRREDGATGHVHVQQAAGQPVEPGRKALEEVFREPRAEQDLAHPDEQRQGRQGVRKRVVEGKRVSDSVDFEGLRNIKQTHTKSGEEGRQAIKH